MDAAPPRAAAATLLRVVKMEAATGPLRGVKILDFTQVKRPPGPLPAPSTGCRPDSSTAPHSLHPPFPPHPLSCIALPVPAPRASLCAPPPPRHLPPQHTRAGPAQYQNGPQATAMLCDYGAEVIKIERAAGGDPGRSLVSADGVRQPPAAAAPQPRSPQVSHAARCPAPPAVPVLQPGVQPRQALARSRHPPPGVARHSRETGAVG